MPKLKYLVYFLLVFVFTVSVTGQTRNDFRQKYKLSETIETYEVRPGIIAVVFYANTGNVKSIALVPPADYAENGKRIMEMPEKLVKEAIDELIPVTKRGKPCEDLSETDNGQETFQISKFKNVIIDYSKNNGRPTFRSVRIEMITCQQYYQRNFNKIDSKD